MSVLKLLLAASAKSSSLQCPLQAQQWRFLNVHEYQVMILVPPCESVHTSRKEGKQPLMICRRISVAFPPTRRVLN